MSDKRLLGHAVVYPNKPGYMGLDHFLVCVYEDGVLSTKRHATNGTSVETSAIFLNRDHAVQALERNPTCGSEAHLPGEVREVYEENRMVLGPSPAAATQIREFLDVAASSKQRLIMKIPEPICSNNERDCDRPWYWQPDVQDELPTRVSDHLTGRHQYHGVTDSWNYKTREAAVADMKQALEKLGITGHG